MNLKQIVKEYIDELIDELQQHVFDNIAQDENVNSKRYYDEAFDVVIDKIKENHDELQSHHEEELYDSFYDEIDFNSIDRGIREMLKDSEAFNKDPFGYVGMSPVDFY